MTTADFLSDCHECGVRSICAFFPEPEVQAVVRKGFWGRNCLVFQQGKAANQVMIVRSGLLRLSHLSPSGKVASELAGPGTILGVPEVMTASALSRSVETMEETVLECVDGVKFLSLLNSHPRLAVGLLKAVSSQILGAVNVPNNNGEKLSSEQRLLLTLKRISRDYGASTPLGTRIMLTLSMQELADMTGCSRQWIWKLLGDLEAAGKIRRRGGWITLLNPEQSVLAAQSRHQNNTLTS